MTLTRWIFGGGRFSAWRRAVTAAAMLWRPMLRRTTWIGITGSVGKTTAKECLAAILSTQHPTACTFDTQNARHGVSRSILRVRPWHRYAVLEFGAAQRHFIEQTAPLARPSVAVVLSVAASHLTHYGTLDNIAAAKRKLVEAVPPQGLAVLNADDPRVAAMAARCAGRVVTFGRAPHADFRAYAVSATWPHRLAFMVRHRDWTCRVETRLVGEQYLPSVLAAVATAVSLGLDLEDAAGAVATPAPHNGRTQPVELPNGAVILRDEFGGNWLHVRAGLQVLRRAKVRRRVAVLGVISEGGKRYQKTARQLGRLAAGCADALVFVGPGWRYGVKGGIEGGLPAECVWGFATAREAAELLRRELRGGDLAYLTGRVRLHLTRIAYAQLGQVDCWRENCQLPILCDYCPELGFRSSP